MRWPFTKSVGCGNDFILFDNRQGNFPLSQPHLIQRLCHRQWGIGADGILLLERSMQADCCMRILNSDGSEAEMCGNGLRCFVKWLETLGFNHHTYRIEVKQRVFKASAVGSAVCIEMGEPREIQWNIPLTFRDQLLTVHHLNTGVPHTVLFVEDSEQIPLIELGRYIRWSPLWMPQGTNVTLVELMGSQKLKIRTYERGVEAETLACGTGAVAAALTAAYHSHLSAPVSIQTRSGEDLQVSFSFENRQFSHVILIGPARCTFQGEIELDESGFHPF